MITALDMMISFLPYSILGFSSALPNVIGLGALDRILKPELVSCVRNGEETASYPNQP